MRKYKLGQVRGCKECGQLIRLSNVGGSVRWCHAPGQLIKCQQKQARKEAREEKGALHTGKHH